MSSDRLVSELYSQAQGGDEASWRAYADWLQEQEHEASRRLGAAIARQEQGPLGLRFAPLAAGTFWMGGGGKAGDERVTIEAPFALAVFPVTQGQWRAVMGDNPSFFSRSGGGAFRVRRIPDALLGPLPVEQVSRNDVQVFLERLNDAERKSGVCYRLPTEAEWEYACRGGARSRQDCSYHYYFQRPTNDLSSHEANCDGNHPFGDAQKGPDLQRTRKVGSYPANPLGIYDLHGNVWEWTSDLQEGGSGLVIRGGSWGAYAEYCQAARRNWYAPHGRHNNIGFRLARVPAGQ